MSTNEKWDRVRAAAFAGDPESTALLDSPAYRFAAAMIAARNNRGWSQRQLAERVGVSQPRIARLETGERDPRLSTMVAVSRALDLPLHFAEQDLAAS